MLAGLKVALKQGLMVFLERLPESSFSCGSHRQKLWFHMENLIFALQAEVGVR